MIQGRISPFSTEMLQYKVNFLPVRWAHNARLVYTAAEQLDKNSGFVEEDNSGRSNIFSTGEKALYSYSPTAEKLAKQGLGGLQGLSIAISVATLVVVATVAISKNE